MKKFVHNKRFFFILHLKFLFFFISHLFDDKTTSSDAIELERSSFVHLNRNETPNNNENNDSSQLMGLCI
jgi:hypothetical protein